MYLAPVFVLRPLICNQNAKSRHVNVSHPSHPSRCCWCFSLSLLRPLSLFSNCCYAQATRSRDHTATTTPKSLSLDCYPHLFYRLMCLPPWDDRAHDLDTTGLQATANASELTSGGRCRRRPNTFPPRIVVSLLAVGFFARPFFPVDIHIHICIRTHSHISPLYDKQAG